MEFFRLCLRGLTLRSVHCQFSLIRILFIFAGSLKIIILLWQISDIKHAPLIRSLRNKNSNWIWGIRNSTRIFTVMTVGSLCKQNAARCRVCIEHTHRGENKSGEWLELWGGEIASCIYRFSLALSSRCATYSLFPRF